MPRQLRGSSSQRTQVARQLQPRTCRPQPGSLEDTSPLDCVDPEEAPEARGSASEPTLAEDQRAEPEDETDSGYGSPSHSPSAEGTSTEVGREDTEGPQVHDNKKEPAEDGYGGGHAVDDPAGDQDCEEDIDVEGASDDDNDEDDEEDDVEEDDGECDLAYTYDCTYTEKAQKAITRARKTLPRRGRGFVVTAVPSGFQRSLTGPVLQQRVEEFFGKSLNGRRSHLIKRTAVYKVGDPAHPAFYHGRIKGRTVEWKLVSRGVKGGEVLGEFTGDVCTAKEMLEKYESHKGGSELGKFTMDKVFDLASCNQSAGWKTKLHIDATVRGNGLKFMNHAASKEANCTTVEVQSLETGALHLLLFAKTVVPKGGELLLDYGQGLLEGGEAAGNPFGSVLP